MNEKTGDEMRLEIAESTALQAREKAIVAYRMAYKALWTALIAVVMLAILLIRGL